MHLKNGDHISRFSGAVEEHVQVKVQSNGAVKTQENGENIDCAQQASTQSNGQTSQANEVNLNLPTELGTEVVLNNILAGWTILVQRYQRDLFHQFTWGF